MDISKYHLNYCTVKRRGYDEATYKYIYTLHTFPVRMSGYDDVDYLKAVNSRFDNNLAFNDDSLRFEASLVRSKSRVMQLGFNNKWDYFVTLTLDERKVDRYDYKSVIKVLLKFFDNYKQRKSNLFRYLVIPEQHKDGAWHFHGFFANIAPADLVTNEHGYLDFRPYSKKFGFCSLSPVRDAEKCASYITKYITKDMFLKAPEPRTHLYFASRGLKFDEVISVGTAPADLADLKCYECCHNTFCAKYEAKDNIFSRFVLPFVDLDRPVELPSDDVMQRLKTRALYDFCNSNGLYINDKSDLLKMYEALRDEIVDDKLMDYDKLVRHYSQLRAEKSSLVAKLKKVFALGAVNDVVVDLNYGEFMPVVRADVLQNESAAVGSPPQLPEPVIQMNIFDDEDDIPCF